MKLRSERLILCAAVFVTLLVAQGCIGVVATTVYFTEQERLKELKQWEDNLALQDCEGLDAAYVDLVAAGDTLVDYEERLETITEVFENKNC
ncbi:MAG: hypothetical protein AAF501_09965, partial [Pseudomonadota bacterium]